MSQTIKAYDTLFSELITSVRGTTMEKIQQKQYILKKLETLWRGVQQDMKLLEELIKIQGASSDEGKIKDFILKRL